MRLAYWAYRLISFARYSLGRKMTPLGWCVLAGAVVATMLGTDIRRSMNYQVAVALTGLLAMAFFWSLRFRGAFDVTRTLPRFATVGQPFRYRLSVHNTSARRQDGLIVRDELEDPRPSFPDYVRRERMLRAQRKSFRVVSDSDLGTNVPAKIDEAPLPPMSSGAHTETEVTVHPQRRGILRFRRVLLARTDPLGLLKAFHRIARPESMVILPKRYPMPPMELPGSTQYQAGGVNLASSVGQSDEFIGLREYRPGDPIRHLHWKSLARTRIPHVKEFEDEFFVRHALLLDTFTRYPISPIFEAAVSVAASLACTVQSQESLLDLMFVGNQAYCFTAGRGVGHTQQLLEVLASVATCPDRPFDDLSKAILDHADRLSGCLCVLVDWNEERRALVEQLQARQLPLWVLIVTTPEAAEQIDTAPIANAKTRVQTVRIDAIAEDLAKCRR